MYAQPRQSNRWISKPVHESKVSNTFGLLEVEATQPNILVEDVVNFPITLVKEPDFEC